MLATVVTLPTAWFEFILFHMKTEEPSWMSLFPKLLCLLQLSVFL
jgi:hypothetical protein